MAETVPKGGSSTIQNDVDELMNQSVANKFQRMKKNIKNCGKKFSKSTTQYEPIKIHNNSLEVVKG